MNKLDVMTQTIKLSIIIPCYNEEQNIDAILEKVNAVDFGNTVETEFIIVDDGSSDRTRHLLETNHSHHKLLFHGRNQGKGMAIRTGIKHVTGDYVVIQDADMEYNPQNIKSILDVMIENDAEVVYGSRTHNRKHCGASFYWGGQFLTWLTNFLYGSSITDEPTCYKMFKTNILIDTPLTCKRFEFCPEITAKVLKKGIHIFEIPIEYFPRSKSEGKKINWVDGVEAIWTLLKFRVIS
ncbi:glycosyltransferase family 2 protein [bacterium]|nr:glycosyltransferase family 2 protein [bacterium]